MVSFFYSVIVISYTGFFLLFPFESAMSFYLLQHPLERRIGYIYGLKDVTRIDEEMLGNLQVIFKKYPLLIFKDLEEVTPKDFIHFVKQFDEDRDEDAIENPDKFPHQMLQPFDQFPDCKHVAPRGNVELLNFHEIKNIVIKPYDAFVDHYVWHTDILGHEYKLPNVVTGFYIIEQPLIGGDTDFISGETIYENLSKDEQLAAQNILVEINRRKFITNSLDVDYAGVNRLEIFEEREDGNTQIPLVYAPDDKFEEPRILIMPTFFERVVGWSVADSRKWMSTFMTEHVLPHRISIQWKKGDLAVFNNRRFIHSSTPARNYMDNKDSSKRLLLQTFIPTNKPLMGMRPSEKNVYACYNVGWIKDQEVSIISAHNLIKFAKRLSDKIGEMIVGNSLYTLSKKVEKMD